MLVARLCWLPLLSRQSVSPCWTGNEGGVVQVDAEELPLGGHHADDAEMQAADAQALAERRLSLPKSSSFNLLPSTTKARALRTSSSGGNWPDFTVDRKTMRESTLTPYTSVRRVRPLPSTSELPRTLGVTAITLGSRLSDKASSSDSGQALEGNPPGAPPVRVFPGAMVMTLVPNWPNSPST